MRTTIFQATVAAVSAGNLWAGNVKGYNPTISSFSASAMYQPNYQPAVSSFSANTMYQPTSASFSAGPLAQPFANTLVKPTYIPGMSMINKRAYQPAVSSFSAGALTKPYLPAPFAKPWISGSKMLETGGYYSAPLSSGMAYGYDGTTGSPFNAEALRNMPSQVVVSRNKGARGLVDQQFAGVEHVIHNDLQVHENHELDKTILTKKIVHHAPVLHKTIRTHEIQQDNVHEKNLHHLNTVEDQWRKVPGQSYVGGQSNVDHTKPLKAAPRVQVTPRKSVRNVAHNVVY